MFPEGWAYIGNCRKCGDIIVRAYVDGLPLKIDRVSIPLKDAYVLRKYWDIILNIWPDWFTEQGLAGREGRPIRFHATQWATQGPPSRGRLYIRHTCRIKRRATKHVARAKSTKALADSGDRPSW